MQPYETPLTPPTPPTPPPLPDQPIAPTKEKGEDLVEQGFRESAGKYWGKIGKVRVLQTKTTETGTVYYLVVADTIKKGNKTRLLQIWYIGKSGEAKPAYKKTIDLPEEFSDEVSMMLTEDFEIPTP